MHSQIIPPKCSLKPSLQVKSQPKAKYQEIQLKTSYLSYEKGKSDFIIINLVLIFRYYKGYNFTSSITLPINAI